MFNGVGFMLIWGICPQFDMFSLSSIQSRHARCVAQAYVVCLEHIDLSSNEDDDQSSLQKMKRKLGELAKLLRLPTTLKVRLEQTENASLVSSCLT